MRNKSQQIRNLVAFGALYCAAASSAYAQVGLVLMPARAELSIKAGEQRSGSLKLISQSEHPVHLRGDALDFQIDENATARYAREIPREKTVSCKNWLTLNPAEFDIKKDSVVNVSYTLRPPAGLTEGSYVCAAGFSTLPNWPQPAEGIGDRSPLNLFATVFVTIGSPAVTGSIKEVKIETVGAKSRSPAGWRAVVVVQNSGTMYFRPKGTFEVLNADGTAIESLDFPSLPVLRQRDQRFIFPIHSTLSPGSYRLRIRIQIGDKPIQEKLTNIIIDTPSAPGRTAEYPFPVFSTEATQPR
jgi:hypothetical protein